MNKEKETLLLIDGHSIVNRAFYGIPPLTNSQGLHTNAIMGFLNIFLKAYSTFSPDYVLVAFDVRQKTFRHDLYSEYKGTRKGMPEELHEQVPVLKDVLHSMGIHTSELPGFEADDVIGTHARRATEEGKAVVILSGDRDLLQLATDTTLVAIPKTKAGGTEIENYYAADVEERYQVTPKEFIDLKALMGDSSDNIPGIPGIGEKTAIKIMTQFHSLENAYEHIEEVTPPRARENLRENIELGRLSRTLATINTDSPVAEDFHDCRVESESSFYNDESYKLFKELELNKLLQRFDMAEITPQSEVEFELKESGSLMADYAATEGAQLSFDFGGAGQQESKLGELPPVGLWADEDLSVAAVSSEGKIVVYSECPADIKEFLKSGRRINVFGLKDLLHALEAEDIRNSAIYDLEIMAYLLDPLKSAYSFDQISKDYLEHIIPSKADLLGKKSFADTLKEEPAKCYKLAAYCASVASEAEPVMKKLLEEAGMWALYTDIEMPLVYSLYYMERAGVEVDRKALEAFSAQLLGRAEELQREIYEEAGEEFNINSPAQLGTILFEKMKLPHGKKTKTGYSTSADVLEKLADEFPFVTKILEYRQVVKLRSTYAEGLTAFISEDGRIHGTFNQTITATGRISSTEPNLQNIPIRRELGQEIRRAFIAREGCVFLDADYSQIELRLLAHLSDDKSLIEAYFSDADIHKITASKVFNTPLDQVTKEQRSNAKAVNFGIVYGISSFGLSQGLSITRKQANDYIKQYFETYPGVKAYLDNTVRRAKLDGYVTTMFGRRRPIPELASSNFMQRSFGERAAMNSPIQGTAADIMKLAMINVEKALLNAGLRARIVLQIHDELLVETPMEEVEQVRQILHDEMKNVTPLSVPLEVEVDEGSDWFTAH